MFADNNLFNSAWTTGNLSAIGPIVSAVGFVVMCIISLGGFFMVVFPIVGNVINGIVSVAPNLCDKIDEAHRSKLGFKSQEGGNQITMVLGSITTAVYALCPNFKAMSDFEKGIKDPKTFMIKSLAMMCISVFIGVFVFYGYPGKVADTFSTAATDIIDLALNNIDPTAWIEKLPANLARPDFSTNSATDLKSKNVNKISNDIYKALVSKYSETSKESRIVVSHEIEDYVTNKINEIISAGNMHPDSEKYALTSEARISTFEPKIDVKSPNYTHDTKNNIYQYQFSIPVNGNFSMGVPGGTDGTYVHCILKFIELSDKPTSATNLENTLNIPNSTSYFVISGSGSNKTITITLPNAENYSFTNNSDITINGFTGKISKKDKNGSSTLTIIFTGLSSASNNTLNGKITSGSLYSRETGSGGTNKITAINVSSSINEPTCIPVSSLYNSWKPGEKPKLKEEQK